MFSWITRSTPKGILAASLSKSLSVYFDINPDQIESNLLSDTKVVLRNVRLRPYQRHLFLGDESAGQQEDPAAAADGRTVEEVLVVLVSGKVDEIEFSWKWGGPDWISDVQLTIRGVRILVSVTPVTGGGKGGRDAFKLRDAEDHRTNKDKTTTTDLSGTKAGRASTKDDGASEETGEETTMERYVRQIVDGLTLRVADVEVMVDLPPPPPTRQQHPSGNGPISVQGQDGRQALRLRMDGVDLTSLGRSGGNHGVGSSSVATGPPSSLPRSPSAPLDQRIRLTNLSFCAMVVTPETKSGDGAGRSCAMSSSMSSPSDSPPPLSSGTDVVAYPIMEPLSYQARATRVSGRRFVGGILSGLEIVGERVDVDDEGLRRSIVVHLQEEQVRALCQLQHLAKAFQEDDDNSDGSRPSTSSVLPQGSKQEEEAEGGTKEAIHGSASSSSSSSSTSSVSAVAGSAAFKSLFLLPFPAISFVLPNGVRVDAKHCQFTWRTDGKICKLVGNDGIDLDGTPFIHFDKKFPQQGSSLKRQPFQCWVIDGLASRIVIGPGGGGGGGCNRQRSFFPSPDDSVNQPPRQEEESILQCSGDTALEDIAPTCIDDFSSAECAVTCTMSRARTFLDSLRELQQVYSDASTFDAGVEVAGSVGLPPSSSTTCTLENATQSWSMEAPGTVGIRLEQQSEVGTGSHGEGGGELAGMAWIEASLQRPMFTACATSLHMQCDSFKVGPSSLGQIHVNAPRCTFSSSSDNSNDEDHGDGVAHIDGPVNLHVESLEVAERLQEFFSPLFEERVCAGSTSSCQGEYTGNEAVVGLPITIHVPCVSAKLIKDHIDLALRQVSVMGLRFHCGEVRAGILEAGGQAVSMLALALEGGVDEESGGYYAKVRKVKELNCPGVARLTKPLEGVEMRLHREVMFVKAESLEMEVTSPPPDPSRPTASSSVATIAPLSPSSSSQSSTPSSAGGFALPFQRLSMSIEEVTVTPLAYPLRLRSRDVSFGVWASDGDSDEGVVVSSLRVGVDGKITLRLEPDAPGENGDWIECTVNNPLVCLPAAGDGIEKDSAVATAAFLEAQYDSIIVGPSSLGDISVQVPGCNFSSPLGNGSNEGDGAVHIDGTLDLCVESMEIMERLQDFMSLLLQQRTDTVTNTSCTGDGSSNQILGGLPVPIHVSRVSARIIEDSIDVTLDRFSATGTRFRCGEARAAKHGAGQEACLLALALEGGIDQETGDYYATIGQVKELNCVGVARLTKPLEGVDVRLHRKILSVNAGGLEMEVNSSSPAPPSSLETDAPLSLSSSSQSPTSFSEAGFVLPFQKLSMSIEEVTVTPLAYPLRVRSRDVSFSVWAPDGDSDESVDVTSLSVGVDGSITLRLEIHDPDEVEADWIQCTVNHPLVSLAAAGVGVEKDSAVATATFLGMQYDSFKIGPSSLGDISVRVPGCTFSSPFGNRVICGDGAAHIGGTLGVRVESLAFIEKLQVFMSPLLRQLDSTETTTSCRGEGSGNQVLAGVPIPIHVSRVSAKIIKEDINVTLDQFSAVGTSFRCGAVHATNNVMDQQACLFAVSLEGAVDDERGGCYAKIGQVKELDFHGVARLTSSLENVAVQLHQGILSLTTGKLEMELDSPPPPSAPELPLAPPSSCHSSLPSSSGGILTLPFKKVDVSIEEVAVTSSDYPFRIRSRGVSFGVWNSFCDTSDDGGVTGLKVGVDGCITLRLECDAAGGVGWIEGMVNRPFVCLQAARGGELKNNGDGNTVGIRAPFQAGWASISVNKSAFGSLDVQIPALSLRSVDEPVHLMGGVVARVSSAEVAENIAKFTSYVTSPRVSDETAMDTPMTVKPTPDGVRPTWIVVPSICASFSESELEVRLEEVRAQLAHLKTFQCKAINILLGKDPLSMSATDVTVTLDATGGVACRGHLRRCSIPGVAKLSKPVMDVVVQLERGGNILSCHVPYLEVEVETASTCASTEGSSIDVDDPTSALSLPFPIRIAVHDLKVVPSSFPTHLRAYDLEVMIENGSGASSESNCIVMSSHGSTGFRLEGESEQWIDAKVTGGNAVISNSSGTGFSLSLARFEALSIGSSSFGFLDVAIPAATLSLQRDECSLQRDECVVDSTATIRLQSFAVLSRINDFLSISFGDPTATEVCGLPFSLILPRLHIDVADSHLKVAALDLRGHATSMECKAIHVLNGGAGQSMSVADIQVNLVNSGELEVNASIGRLEALCCPGVVSLSKPVRNTTVRYTNDASLISLGSILELKLLSYTPNRPHENGHSPTNDVMGLPCRAVGLSLPGIVVTSPNTISQLREGQETVIRATAMQIQLTNVDGDTNEARQIGLGTSSLLDPAISHPQGIQVALGGVSSIDMNGFAKLEDVSGSAILQNGDLGMLHKAFLSVTSVGICATHAAIDWSNLVFGGETEEKAAALNLPHVRIAGTNLHLSYEGRVVSTSGTTIRIDPFVGNQNTNSDDVANHYVCSIKKRLPGLLANTDVMGVNLVNASLTQGTRIAVLGASATTSVLGSGLTQVAGTVVADGVRASVTRGKVSRDASADVGYKFGDFSRGLAASVKDAARSGASQRGGLGYEVGDATVGAVQAAGTYASQNKSKLGGAGGSGVGMAVGAAMLGPVGLVAGAFAGASAGQRIFQDSNAREASEQNQKQSPPPQRSSCENTLRTNLTFATPQDHTSARGGVLRSAYVPPSASQIPSSVSAKEPQHVTPPLATDGNMIDLLGGVHDLQPHPRSYQHQQLTNPPSSPAPSRVHVPSGTHLQARPSTNSVRGQHLPQSRRSDNPQYRGPGESYPLAPSSTRASTNRSSRTFTEPTQPQHVSAQPHTTGGGYHFGDITKSIVAEGKKRDNRSEESSYRFGDFTRGLLGGKKR